MASVSGASHSQNNLPQAHIAKNTQKPAELKTDTVKNKSLEGPQTSPLDKLDNNVKVQPPVDDLQERMLRLKNPIKPAPPIVSEEELFSLLDEELSLSESMDEKPPSTDSLEKRFMQLKQPPSKPVESISPLPLPAAHINPAEMQQRFKQESNLTQKPNTTPSKPLHLQDSFLQGLAKASTSAAAKIESRTPGEFTPAMLDFLFSSGEMRNVSWGLRNEASQVKVGDSFNGDSLNLVPDTNCLKIWSGKSDTLQKAPLFDRERNIDGRYMQAYKSGTSNIFSSEVKQELISKWTEGVDNFISKQLKEKDTKGAPQMTLVQYHQKNMPVHDQERYGLGLGKSTSLRKGGDRPIERKVKTVIPPPPHAEKMDDAELTIYYRAKLLDALDFERQQKPKFNPD